METNTTTAVDDYGYYDFGNLSATDDDDIGLNGILCSVNLSSLDPPSSPPLPCWQNWDALLRKYSFATEGVGLFVVAVVGIVANAISVAILCQRTMKSQGRRAGLDKYKNVFNF
jgi:hypothetical protein